MLLKPVFTIGWILKSELHGRCDYSEADLGDH